MAQGPDSLEHLLSFQVCFHELQEDGEHIPRLLPCSHTLCQSCIKQLIQNNKLECPECRKTHDAEDVKSFPQNKYLLSQIKRNPKDDKSALREAGICKEHQKELVLFCTERTCQKAICIVCLKQSHRKHDVTDVEDGRREVALKDIFFIKRNLQMKMAMISTTKNDIKTNAENCIRDIIKDKETVNNHFEAMLKKARKTKEEVITQLNDEIATLTENLRLLTNIAKNMEEDGGTGDKTDEYETVNELKENANNFLSGGRTYTYLEYAPSVISASSRAIQMFYI